MELRPTRYDHPDAVELTTQTQRYYVEIYGGPDDDPLAAADFAPPNGGFLVGYVADAPVAMGGWTFTADAGGGRDAQIRRMFTRPDVRRARFGAQLLEALEADATASGARRMVLSTGSRQPEAIAFYRAAGYRDIAPFGFYGGESGVVCLGKSLGGLRS